MKNPHLKNQGEKILKHTLLEYSTNYYSISFIRKKGRVEGAIAINNIQKQLSFKNQHNKGDYKCTFTLKTSYHAATPRIKSFRKVSNFAKLFRYKEV